jgi:SNF2 family DNA or RNA helicase
MSSYGLKTEPRLVQVEDLQVSLNRHVWGRWWEMRTGKGVATCYEIDVLMRRGTIRRALVVAPKRVLSTWQEELRAHTHDLPVAVYPKMVSEGVVLVNYDRVWERSRRVHLAAPLAKWRPDMVVADEAHLVKNRRAARSRAMYHWAEIAPWRRALTGTPDPSSYADYWGIFRFLEPSVFGAWTEFANRYLILDWWGRVVGYRSLDDLAAKVHAYGSRARRADYFDCPRVVEETVTVELPGAARRVYRDMAESLYAELSADPVVVTQASIPLVRLLRLAQITGGHVTTEDHGTQWLHDAKVDALDGVLEEALADGAQVVVFVRFRAELARIEERLRRRGVPSVSLHGDTADTGAALRRFRSGEARVFLCQIQAGRLGLDLSAARVLVYYSWGYDAEAYLQARERIWRPGADQTLTIFHLVVPGTIDQTMLDIVRGKIDRSALVLDRWRDLVEGAAHVAP